MRAWVTYGTPDTCQCWRAALCPHGWTWDGGEDGIPMCEHTESYEDPHESLADAVRYLFTVHGYGAIGSLLRLRYPPDTANRWTTREVYVMPPGIPSADDHDADDGPHPLAVIARYDFQARTTARRDVGGAREFANSYRPKVTP